MMLFGIHEETMANEDIMFPFPIAPPLSAIVRGIAEIYDEDVLFLIKSNCCSQICETIASPILEVEFAFPESR